MWEREDRVLVFSGLIDSSGTKTDVQIGTIVEVGEYELLIKFSNRSWDGPRRISKERCMPILRNFHIPDPSPHPEVGDLILVANSTYRSDQEKKIVVVVSAMSGVTNELINKSKWVGVSFEALAANFGSVKGLNPHTSTIVDLLI